MQQGAVEKPKGRQPTYMRFRIGTWTLLMRVGLVMMLVPGVTGWAQSGEQAAVTPSAAHAPKLVTPGAGYRLHQGDKIEVRFFYQPEMNQETVVKPDGTVSLQLIGEVPAEGKTAQQLATLAAERYASVLVDPAISVILKEFVKPRVFVGGQVTKPGPYELRDGDTLAQALILAGGFTSEAHRKQVIHARPMGEGQLRITVVDTTKLYSKHPIAELNLTLRDGDLIFVPDSKLSRISHILGALRIQSFGLFTDPFRK